MEAGQEDCEGDISLLEKAPLRQLNVGTQIKYVDSRQGLLEVVKQASEVRWVGVDVEHSRDAAYYGLVCLI